MTQPKSTLSIEQLRAILVLMATLPTVINDEDFAALAGMGLRTFKTKKAIAKELLTKILEESK